MHYHNLWRFNQPCSSSSISSDDGSSSFPLPYRSLSASSDLGISSLVFSCILLCILLYDDVSSLNFSLRKASILTVRVAWFSSLFGFANFTDLAEMILFLFPLLVPVSFADYYYVYTGLILLIWKDIYFYLFSVNIDCSAPVRWGRLIRFCVFTRFIRTNQQRQEASKPTSKATV